jgi:NitT/TauT family transport system substrate-binding protein
MLAFRLSRRSALATLGALAATRAALRAQTLPVVRASYIPFENSGQLFYGKELGIFAKHGFDVELQPNPFGAAIASSVASNAVDVGYATVMTLAAAHVKGIPFVIVSPANQFEASKPAGGKLVAASAAVKTGKDLNGKTIGSPGLNTLGEYGVRAWVDANGGDAATLRFVELPFPEMSAAMTSGRIDAAFVAEPFLQQAEKANHVVALELDAVAKNFLVAGWFTTSDWAHGHADLVRRFDAGMREASDWAEKNPQLTLDILVKYLKVERATLLASPRADIAHDLNPALIQPGIDVTARYAKFPTFPARDLIYVPGR